jgi:hypothetical protein
MTSKSKSQEMYDYSRELHGEEKAKEEAIKSAIAVKALVPMLYKDYWEKVIDYLKEK